MDAREIESNDKWNEILSRMLPAGSPLPDQDHLDYSIAIEYHGPPVPYAVPRIEPLKFESASTSHYPPNVSWSGRNPTIQSQRTSSVSRTLLEILYSTDRDEEEDASSSQIPMILQSNDPISTCDTEMDYDGDVSSSRSSLNYFEASPIPVKKRETWFLWRTGTCSRCGIRSRLREREVCIVCEVRYCRNCLIRAMGSMPEGRKCLVCIGIRIDESNRSSLGKSSRMLRNVCSSLQVRQIMKAEKECPVNQLTPEQLFVNGKQLREKELAEILNCPNPPQYLKPGKYWYDKYSGYWGKDGEKPNMIITPKLNVRGKLQTNASNGNTKVYINLREITTNELRFLKLTKVPCSKNTQIWLNDDGSYEEEGQNNIKGNIWGKASTRFFCSLLSLPVPSTNPVLPKEDHLVHGKPCKVLLVGLEGSGTSTIFKQVKFMYDKRFSSEELHNIKLMIQSNMFRYLSVILEGRERFEEEALSKQQRATTEISGGISWSRSESSSSSSCVYSINPRLKHYSDWLLGIMAKGDMDMFFLAATREYAPVIDEIWKDKAIQETYKRRHELRNLPDVAKHFLNRAVEISNNEYEPSEMDMFYAEGVTPSHGLSSFEFSFDDQNFERYQLIRLHSKGLVTEGCKRLEMLEDVGIIVFCVSLSDYEYEDDDSGCLQNKMMASRELFISLVKQSCFANTPFVVLLNKYDVFEEKVNRIPIAVCEWFKDFNPLKSGNKNNCNIQTENQAYYYVAVKFKKLFSYLTGGRKLFVWRCRGRESKSVDEAFMFVREVVKWDQDKIRLD